MKITEILAEANPHNYDSDVDYYAALNKEKRDATYGRRHHPAPTPPMSDQDAEGEIAHRRVQQAAAAAKEVQVKWEHDDGVTPDGKRYNSVCIIIAPSLERLNHEIRSTVDYHHGAKKLVDKKIVQSKMINGPAHGWLFFVDNHKHGMWKPWKDEPAIGESATAGATSAANIGTVDAPQLSPGKARGKKSYLGSPSTGSGTKAPPQPKVVQPKAANGTAKNALDMKGANLFGGATVKRS
jgi:hypothetical protein